LVREEKRGLLVLLCFLLGYSVTQETQGWFHGKSIAILWELYKQLGE
jgi:hypothetical protein